MKGTWWQVFRPLVLFVVGMMAFRYAFYEPFVIPSGSMEQTLLIQDYIVVHKSAYGWRIPFTKTWLSQPSGMQRGDVVVFRSVDDDNFFMIKRLIGMPGDEVEVDVNNRIKINGKEHSYTKIDEEHLTEKIGIKEYQIQTLDGQNKTGDSFSIKVPEGHIFVMGDNRDRSHDSRFWGALPISNLIGKAKWIAISCDGKSQTSDPFCPSGSLRMDRLGKKIN